MKRVDATSYLTMAESYWAAAQQIRPGPNQADPSPFYMAACHSIELSLKAVLLAQGARHDWIMMVGHNLERCLADAVDGGLSSCPPDLAPHVSSLSYAHSAQGFRYPISWEFDLPDPDATMAATTRLLRLSQQRVADLHASA